MSVNLKWSRKLQRRGGKMSESIMWKKWGKFISKARGQLHSLE